MQPRQTQTESYEYNNCDIENAEWDGRVLDANDECGIVGHGMSKPLSLVTWLLLSLR